jgi:sirohydrochlorin cobaltochelatase
MRFIRVEAMTLREDWPEKRKAAEQRVRDFVTQGTSEGRRVLVIPFRLFGFGPYEEVLEGLEYSADRSGLLPHANVTRWISRQAEELRAGPFLVSKR